MKKIIYLTLALGTLLAACKKSSSDETQPTTTVTNTTNGSTNGISAVPATFTQKALIEVFTGAPYGNCPSGMTSLNAVITAVPGRIFGACIHNDDGMAISSLVNTMSATFAYSSFPSGMVNRTASLGNVNLQPSEWQNDAASALTKTPNCGLAITSSVSGNTATIEVHAGFNSTLTNSYNMTVYLTEDLVTGTGSGYDQVNNDDNNASSPYYHHGNPIVGFTHNYVVRKVLTANLGDPITGSLITPGGQLIKTITTDVSAYNKANLYVVAFVNRAGNSAITYPIMNVQRAKLGALQNWD